MKYARSVKLYQAQVLIKEGLNEVTVDRMHAVDRLQEERTDSVSVGTIALSHTQ